MKINQFAAALLLLGGVNASAAAVYTPDDCETLRDSLATLSRSLQAVDANTERVAENMHPVNGTLDLSEYDKTFSQLAEEISQLTAQVDHFCKYR